MTGPYRPFQVRLTARQRLSPSFVRLTLSGADLRHCSPTLLDQRVKLLVGDVSSFDDDWYATWTAMPSERRPAMRTYTLSAVRPQADEVDIDVVLHAQEGPVGTFAADAAVGEACLLVAPDVRREGHDEVGLAWRPNGAREVLVVADETALPAVVNIVGALAPDVVGRVVVEVPRAGDIRELPAPAGVAVTWCVKEHGGRAADAVDFERAEAPDAADDDLLWEEASGDSWYGWVAGEAGMVRQVRAAAKASGVAAGSIAFMGYWKAGVAGVG